MESRSAGSSRSRTEGSSPDKGSYSIAQGIRDLFGGVSRKEAPPSRRSQRNPYHTRGPRSWSSRSGQDSITRSPGAGQYGTWSVPVSPSPGQIGSRMPSVVGDAHPDPECLSVISGDLDCGSICGQDRKQLVLKTETQVQTEVVNMQNLAMQTDGLELSNVSQQTEKTDMVSTGHQTDQLVMNDKDVQVKPETGCKSIQTNEVTVKEKKTRRKFLSFLK
ncbi:hypothetical protein HDE_01991 [Halotydeus destructor]|nr:hypothetical protein HDE_01991 [Halotydeus destructor]